MDDLAAQLTQQRFKRAQKVNSLRSAYQARQAESGAPTSLSAKWSEPIGSDGRGGIRIAGARNSSAEELRKSNANVISTPSGILTSRSLIETRGSVQHAIRVIGSFVGSAIGDALAGPVEFMSFEQILERWPPVGPSEHSAGHSRITDDTQMAIAVARSLLGQPPEGPLLEVLTSSLLSEFVAWRNSPENDRAPGNTCMSATKKLESGLSWLEATATESKGCGANMRVHPVAYRYWRERDDRIRSRVSQFQAAMTHGHPTALAASDATSLVVALLLRGVAVHEVLDSVLNYAADPPPYDRDWLGDLWRRAGTASPAAFVEVGWSELRATLEKIMPALVADDGFSDPCLVCGDGWIAEEALGTALYCFFAHCWDQAGAGDALRRAAVTRGDSDSIACLVGAFVGACDGTAAYSRAASDALERRDEIVDLAAKLSEF